MAQDYINLKIAKNNFFIITGGPGSGKSSVLEELKTLGYTTVCEVGRKIIKEQLAIGGNAIHSGDQAAFLDLMFKYSLADFTSLADKNNIVFFDRGIPELLGYSWLISKPISKVMLDAIKQYRYNSNVFLFPPWEDIYKHDEERKQDFQEAVATYQYIKRAYLESGYKLVEVPKISISSRVEFIKNYIKDLSLE